MQLRGIGRVAPVHNRIVVSGLFYCRTKRPSPPAPSFRVSLYPNIASTGSACDAVPIGGLRFKDHIGQCEYNQGDQ